MYAVAFNIISLPNEWITKHWAMHRRHRDDKRLVREHTRAGSLPSTSLIDITYGVNRHRTETNQTSFCRSNMEARGIPWLDGRPNRDCVSCGLFNDNYPSGCLSDPTKFPVRTRTFPSHCNFGASPQKCTTCRNRQPFTRDQQLDGHRLVKPRGHGP